MNQTQRLSDRPAGYHPLSKYDQYLCRNPITQRCNDIKKLLNVDLCVSINESDEVFDDVTGNHLGVGRHRVQFKEIERRPFIATSEVQSIDLHMTPCLY